MLLYEELSDDDTRDVRDYSRYIHEIASENLVELAPPWSVLEAGDEGPCQPFLARRREI